MGTMSTSDAAPLPRLGEVFFDVRSAARSLRISWYADTGVAVLSIWQGGTCTGSFRLPMADLPRMIETLQRGPDVPAGDCGPGMAAAEYGPGAAAGDYQPAGWPDPGPVTGAGYREQPGPARHAARPGRQPGPPAGPPEPDWDSGRASPAGAELAPLPESFPYGIRLPDHELR